MTATETIESPMSSHKTQPAPINVNDNSLSAIMFVLLLRRGSGNHLHGARQPADAAAAVARDDPDLREAGRGGSGPLDAGRGLRRAQRFEVASGRIEAVDEVFAV